MVPVHKLNGFLNANFYEKKIKQLFTTDKILTIQRKNYRAIRMCNDNRDNRETKRRLLLHTLQLCTYVMKQPPDIIIYITQYKRFPAFSFTVMT